MPITSRCTCLALPLSCHQGKVISPRTNVPAVLMRPVCQRCDKASSSALTSWQPSCELLSRLVLWQSGAMRCTWSWMACPHRGCRTGRSRCTCVPACTSENLGCRLVLLSSFWNGFMQDRQHMPGSSLLAHAPCRRPGHAAMRPCALQPATQPNACVGRRALTSALTHVAVGFSGSPAAARSWSQRRWRSSSSAAAPPCASPAPC